MNNSENFFNRLRFLTWQVNKLSNSTSFVIREGVIAFLCQFPPNSGVLGHTWTHCGSNHWVQCWSLLSHVCRRGPPQLAGSPCARNTHIHSNVTHDKTYMANITITNYPCNLSAGLCYSENFSLLFCFEISYKPLIIAMIACISKDNLLFFFNFLLYIGV